jgi:hypothetical protein
MSMQHCDECGFLYENINFCPCPTCRMLKGEKKMKFKPNHVLIHGEEYEVENHEIELNKDVEPKDVAEAFNIPGSPKYIGYWFVKDASAFVYHVPDHDVSQGHKEYIAIKSRWNHLTMQRDWFIAGYNLGDMQERSKQGAAICHNCKKVCWSLYRHDYHACSCKEDNKQICVDGGTSYMRMSMGKEANYEMVTINHLTRKLTKGYDDER